MVQIRITTGEQKGESLAVDQSSVILGRGTNADFQVIDEGVSRKHAEVFRIGNACFIKDLGSTNSTFLNDHEVTKEELLQPGDEIQIGTTKLQFEDPENEDTGQVHLQDDQKELGEDTIEYTFQEEEESQDVHQVGVQEQPDDLNVLFEAGTLVGSEENKNTLLQKVLDLSVDVSNASSGFLFQLDPESGQLLPRGEHQNNSEKDAPISRTIIRRVLRTSRSILTSDASSDERFAPSTSVVVKEIQSVMCVPIIEEGNAVGVIYLHESGPEKTFTEDTLKLLTSIAFQTGIALSRIKAEQKLRETTTKAIRMIVRGIEAADPDTQGHSERVAGLARSIGEKLNLSTNEQEILQRAALLHDIGKIVETGTPHSDDVEHPEQLHIQKGTQLLEESDIFQDVIPGIKYHHVQMDGSGIPEGETGEQFPLWVHVLIVANKFDNILHNPDSHQEMVSIKEAVNQIETMAEEGKIHQEVASALVESYDEGTLFSSGLPFEGE